MVKCKQLHEVPLHFKHEREHPSLASSSFWCLNAFTFK